MNIIYLLLRHDDDINYDECAAFVICAPTPAEARKMANEACADEGQIWESDKVTCRKIGSAMKTVLPGIVLCDYRAA